GRVDRPEDIGAGIQPVVEPLVKVASWVRGRDDLAREVGDHVDVAGRRGTSGEAFSRDEGAIRRADAIWIAPEEKAGFGSQNVAKLVGLDEASDVGGDPAHDHPVEVPG